MQTLGLIGCGKMGYALAKGIFSSRPTAQLLVNDISQERIDLFINEFGASSASLSELVNLADVIILAIKPQQVQNVMQQTDGSWSGHKVLLSIVAGLPTYQLEHYTSTETAVIRAMPNTPSLIGQGVCAISPGSNAQEADMLIAKQLLKPTGMIIEVQEEQMNLVTALSGSGPAYMFYIAESMINAGVNLGLDYNTSRQLVLNTMAGSIEMLQTINEHPAALRDQVCSPGGTTVAALAQFERDGLRAAIYNAIEAAYLRSIELGNKK